MRKIKFKKCIKISLIIIFIFIIILSFNDRIIYKENNNNNDNKKNILETIYAKLKDNDIDKTFINWVNDNYKDSLEKLDKLLENETYDKSMWHKATGNSYYVLRDLYNDSYSNMDNIKVLKTNNPSTISIVGDISLADNWHIAPKYDERGGINGILGSEMLNIMTSSDLMIANSEFTVSNRGSKMPNKQYTFRAKPERLAIYYEMGVDLVTLANNHVYDYGKDAFLDMLDSFDQYKISHIGAGHNLEEAMKPYYFIINGYKFAFISASRSEKYRLTPGATENTEGIFLCYDTTNIINLIKELKENSDYIIPIIHFGKENSHELESVQISSAKAYIDAGASMVVGHHAHTLQGVEIYKDKPIIYNLGNFLFNQNKIDTALFKIIVNEDGNLEYYMIPALQNDYKTEILSGSERDRVINDLNSWSINAFIDKNGKINKKGN